MYGDCIERDAIAFALCNRKLMMERICQTIGDVYPDTQFEPMINIAHNYAASGGPTGR